MKVWVHYDITSLCVNLFVGLKIACRGQFVYKDKYYLTEFLLNYMFYSYASLGLDAQ